MICAAVVLRISTDCVQVAGRACPGARVELLIADFRDRVEPALPALSKSAADAFIRTLEMVPRLYAKGRHGLAGFARIAASGQGTKFRNLHQIGSAGQSGGGIEEVHDVVRDLRQVGCDVLTIGQYPAPSDSHLPVERYYTAEEFAELQRLEEEMGFQRVNSGPLLRSSYHAEDYSGLI